MAEQVAKSDPGTAAAAAPAGAVPASPNRGRHQAQPTSPWAAFLPNHAISGTTATFIVVAEVALALLIWWRSPFEVLPRPDEVLAQFKDLWLHRGLPNEMWTSFKLSAEALAISTAISLVLSYLTVIPVFRPLVNAVSKGRFLTLVGFTFVFTLMFGGGHTLKVSMLVFGETVFFVTSMASVVAAIPREEFDHARTLRMSEWRVVWEVVILGTADKAFEVLRQNAAIGWMMVTMVEGVVRAEGGVGAMLIEMNKYFRMADVFAIQLCILGIGLLQDYFLGLVRAIFCPYADITLERK